MAPNTSDIFPPALRTVRGLLRVGVILGVAMAAVTLLVGTLYSVLGKEMPDGLMRHLLFYSLALIFPIWVLILMRRREPSSPGKIVRGLGLMLLLPLCLVFLRIVFEPTVENLQSVSFAYALYPFLYVPLTIPLRFDSEVCKFYGANAPKSQIQFLHRWQESLFRSMKSRP